MTIRVVRHVQRHDGQSRCIETETAGSLTATAQLGSTNSFIVLNGHSGAPVTGQWRVPTLTKCSQHSYWSIRSANDSFGAARSQISKSVYAASPPPKPALRPSAMGRCRPEGKFATLLPESNNLSPKANLLRCQAGIKNALYRLIST